MNTTTQYKEFISYLLDNNWIIIPGSWARGELTGNEIQKTIKDMGFNSEEHLRWINDRADYRRYEFDLNENSVVIDAGGYKGEWAQKISAMYSCRIFIFEPVREFFDEIDSLFSKNQKIIAYNVGLSDKYEKVKINLDNDATSIFGESDNTQEIVLHDFNQTIIDNKIEKIDLMKINIEGGEYALLRSMIANGTHKKVKNILVQFHKISEFYESSKLAISNELERTHERVWGYEFIWECWRLKE